MAIHGSREQGPRLPDPIPLPVPRVSRLSWELGARVLGDDATLHGTWNHTDTRWELSVFRVADHTDLIRVRSPVGREHFYGVARSDLRSALPTLETTPEWIRKR